MSDLLSVNVNEHTEKKGGLTYLSWAWAWAEVLKHDPQASWELVEYPYADGTRGPCMWIGETALVKTTVTVKGVTRSCQLAVMDNRNNAVKLPDARKLSDAIMRCMTKAVAMHGLGLYIYAGEDLPQGDEPPAAAPAPAPVKQRTGAMADVLATMPALDEEWTLYYKELAANVEDTFTSQGAASAFDRVTAEGLDSEGTMYLWSMLGSKVRSALKAEKVARGEKAA